VWPLYATAADVVIRDCLDYDPSTAALGSGPGSSSSRGGVVGCLAARGRPPPLAGPPRGKGHHPPRRALTRAGRDYLGATTPPRDQIGVASFVVRDSGNRSDSWVLVGLALRA